MRQMEGMGGVSLQDDSSKHLSTKFYVSLCLPKMPSSILLTHSETCNSVTNQMNGECFTSATCVGGCGIITADLGSTPPDEHCAHTVGSESDCGGFVLSQLFDNDSGDLEDMGQVCCNP